MWIRSPIVHKLSILKGGTVLSSTCAIFLITINVPIVYMTQDGMILMRALSIYEGHWKGWAMN